MSEQYVGAIFSMNKYLIFRLVVVRQVAADTAATCRNNILTHLYKHNMLSWATCRRRQLRCFRWKQFTEMCCISYKIHIDINI